MSTQETLVKEEGKESSLWIREVVLNNLKSFRGKTRIELDRGFTAISGPNGSGKSNIIDALGFACGVQTTRALRADNLTDLIHKNGDVNEAWVKVVFEDSDGDTFSIKRRIKKTKKDYYSYYYIDGKSCNLSDIQDRLYEAGMPKEGHNIVMQGDVTRVTETTSSKRREILDEVAGVAEFDSKIDKAESELEIVKEKIDRIDIVLNEVRERLIGLEEEREDALRYKELREELGDLDALKELSRYSEIRATTEKLRQGLEDRETEKNDLVQKLSDTRAELAEAQEELERLNEEVSQKGETDLIELRREIESLRGKIARRRDEIDLNEEKIQDLQEETRRLFGRKGDLEERAETREQEVEEKNLSIDAINLDIRDKDTEIEKVQEKLEALDDEFVQLKDRASELRGDLSDAKDAKSDTLRETDRLLHALRRKEDDRARIQREIESIEDDIEEHETQSVDLAKNVKQKEAEREELQETSYEQQRKEQYLRDELDTVEDDLRRAQHKLAKANATVKAAEELDDTYSYPVKKVLEAGRNKNLPGIHGTVGELGTVSEQYSTALETAAGGRLQNVVVATDGDGERAINHLKQRNAGRATFLPLNKIRPRRIRGKARDALDENGVIDLAINLVDFDPKYEDIFQYVFGDTLVVEDMATARRLMGGLRMVTLDGDLVEASGAMKGGSRKGNRFKFARDQEEKVTELSERVTELEGERKKLLTKIQSVESEKEETQSRIRELESEMDRARRDMMELEAKVDRKEKEKKEKQEELETLDETHEQQKKRLAELEGETAELEETIQELTEELDDIESRMADSEAPQLMDQIDSLKAEKSDLQERKREMESSAEQKKMEIGLIEEELEEVERRREEIQERRSNLESEIGEKKNRIAELRDEIQEKVEQEKSLEDELGELRQERDDALSRVNDLEDQERDVKSKIDHVDTRIADLNTTLREKTEELQELQEVVDKYELDPEDAPTPKEIEKRRGDIEREMTSLEPVNMRAIDEYDDVKERESSLTDKHGTLVEEREAVLDRIEGLEDQKRSVFMETFEYINRQFGDIFSTLSPGGTAELILENEEDPFDGGLEVKARPGGKEVHSLEAMSGGEKSLTALSLIFSIQRYDPAPFYAFDEIDMFLDGANAEKVGSMIERMSDHAQFIVVSLRQPTLEKSDRVLGVTMRDGKSRITGVDLGS